MCELLLQLQRHFVGCGAAYTERREVGGAAIVLAHQRCQRRRDHREHRGSLGPKEREDRVSVERPDGYDTRTDRERSEGPQERADM